MLECATNLSDQPSKISVAGIKARTSISLTLYVAESLYYVGHYLFKFFIKFSDTKSQSHTNYGAMIRQRQENPGQ